MKKALSPEKISMFALVLLITGAIDSVRNLPATALFGPSLIFFFTLSAIVFLIPVALISAELASTWHFDEGGIYSWVKRAFGEKVAFFTIWLQWINTMVWYPTILSFIAGTLAYLIKPELASSKFYLITVILTVFWSLTILGLNGIRASAFFASFCAVTGMLIPMSFIIILALIWLIKGHPIAIDLSFHSLFPDWKHRESWVSLTAIITSFLGMELACVHVRNVRDPKKHFPRAILISATLILMTMILGSLAIAFVLPQKNIHLVDGVMQAFSSFLTAYHLKGLMPILTALLVIGSLGSMVNWIISPAKGLLLAADHGYFPHWFYKLNRHGVASKILILQAILVTILCTGFLLFPGMNAIYWLFTSLSTELYVLMYIIMFLAAIRLKAQHTDRQGAFHVPGGKIGHHAICFLGLLGCIATFLIGFIPPSEIAIEKASYYRLVYTIGIFLMILPALFFERYRKRKLG